MRGLSQLPLSMHQDAVEMQAELAARCTNSRHVTAPEAGCSVQFDGPDVVVALIRAMLEATRPGQPFASTPARLGPSDAGPAETAEP